MRAAFQQLSLKNIIGLLRSTSRELNVLSLKRFEEVVLELVP